MNGAGLHEVDAYIAQHLDEAFEDLTRLVGQPSISSQNAGMQECADLVVELLREAGFEARSMETESYPVVYGEAGGQSDRTLICYNHYDVQPPEPLHQWDSPPFQLTQRDGKLYGRGVADDKGHIISRLAALKALRAVGGDYPCRIKFLIEGGEEISSPHLPEFIDMHRDLLAADACVWETGGVNYRGQPNLTLGMRGICYVQYNVQTMGRDAHSGSAHLLPNAAWRLVRALNSVKDENERVLIPGFYDGVRGMTDLDREIFAGRENNHVAMRESYGIASFVLGVDGLAASEAVFNPTANIAGIAGGYEGAGPKTVIPARAMAKMDFRLVPDQDPEDIVEKLRAHLRAGGFDDIEVEYLGGERAAQTPLDDPFVQMCAETAREVYGAEPDISPLVGGSGPMYPFRAYLGVPIVSVGVGYPETLVHAPNENIRVQDFLLGTVHMAHLTARFASEGDVPGARATGGAT